MDTEDVEDELEDKSTDSETDTIDEIPIVFPLPTHDDPTLCRDQFLKGILQPYERKHVKRKRKLETVEEEFEEIRHVRGTVEGLGILKMLQHTRGTIVEHDIDDFRESLTLEEKRFIYKKFLFQFQKAAIEFLSVRMRKQIDTYLNIYPGDLPIIPHNLFHWSVDYFVRRQKVNQLYLEVLTKEKTHDELDCAKYCTDITEIIRLLDATRSDYREDRDLCKGAIQMMHESNFEMNSNWALELDELHESHNELSSRLFANRGYFRESRQSEIAEGIESHVALMPIIMRYRINWMRSNEDQHLLYLQGRERDMQTELDDLNDKITQDISTFRFVDFVYQYQIDRYRSSIIEWQQRLDIDLEEAELKVNVTRNFLVKAKDDLKYYAELAEMYKRRVQEVSELIAEEQTHTARIRRSTRSTLGGSQHRQSTSTRKKSKNANKKKK